MKISKITIALYLIGLGQFTSVISDLSSLDAFKNADPANLTELKELYRQGNKNFNRMSNRVLKNVPRKERRRLFNGTNWGQMATGTGLYYWLRNREKFDEEIAKLEDEEFKQNLSLNLKQKDRQAIIEEFTTVLNNVSDKLKAFEEKVGKNGERILKTSHAKIKKWESMGVDMSELHRESYNDYLKK